MLSIITGDIINSREIPSNIWIEGLKKLLNTKGNHPGKWEIYRGDEFQLEIINPEEALLTAIEIKAYLKTLKLDARMSIGIGEKTYTAEKISESNGSAFVRSGELFETLKKEKNNLAINSGNTLFDLEINLMLRLALTFMDHWSIQSAEFILTVISQKWHSQQEIGMQLGINQAAVSRRQKRAQFELMMELDSFFRDKIKTSPSFLI